jgi:hypothetical protein
VPPGPATDHTRRPTGNAPAIELSVSQILVDAAAKVDNREPLVERRRLDRLDVGDRARRVGQQRGVQQSPGQRSMS